ncbi:phospholipase A2 inhibitor 25 kDa subunit-like [Engystomops pustulosus]|uniref:phospholipase A2 inhibitor 25 kDa subunit-like n=1 Tax=Engystomops pustulosus TaxID=76066 RepID=UPI003AFB5A65
MTSPILTLSLLSALTVTSSALLCTQCVSESSSSCSGPSVTCPPGYECGSSHTKTNVGGFETNVVVRACTVQSSCNFAGIIATPLGKTRVATSCCNTDNCLPAIPQFPAINNTRNGLVCRYCSTADSDWCYTSETVQCTGIEDRCLLQRVKQGGLKNALRGCATKSVCDLGGQTKTDGRSTTEVKHICTDAGISVHKVVLTPAIVSLLLMKIFS